MLKILISNDDGVDAPGINCLYDHLIEVAEVFVVAPVINQSGAGSSLTTNRPMKVEDVKQNFKSLNGRPVDCVHVGIHELCPWKPDLVISGINHGANMGEDLLYSGTVGAALEASGLLFPSIAISSAAFGQPGSKGKEEPNFETAGLVAKHLVCHIESLSLNQNITLNVNVPNVPFTENLKVVKTKIGTWGLRNPPNKIKNSKGHIEYWTAHRNKYPLNDFESDIATLERNEISITPISPNFLYGDSSNLLDDWLKVVFNK
jgi:5'-nucleotidase